MRCSFRSFAGAAGRVILVGVLMLVTPSFVAGTIAEHQRTRVTSCPDPQDCVAQVQHAQRPAKARLDASDAYAALKAINVGLTEVGDGSTFVWHRAHGRLRGTVRPTSSFRDTDGRICRHLIVTLASGRYARTAEGIACRLPDGVWTLEG